MGIALRLVVILLIAALLRSRSLRQLLAEMQRSANHSVILGWTGVALCLLGFGLAISARWHLGRNWGMPMAHKEQPGARRGSCHVAVVPPAVCCLHDTNRDARAPRIPSALKQFSWLRPAFNQKRAEISAPRPTSRSARVSSKPPSRPSRHASRWSRPALIMRTAAFNWT